MARRSNRPDAFAGWTECCCCGPTGTAGAPVWFGMGPAVLRAPTPRPVAAGGVAGRCSGIEELTHVFAAQDGTRSLLVQRLQFRCGASDCPVEQCQRFPNEG